MVSEGKASNRSFRDHQHVRGRFVVQQAVDEAGLLHVQVVAQFGDVCRVQVGQQGFDALCIFLFDKALHLVDVFFVYFHRSVFC